MNHVREWGRIFYGRLQLQTSLPASIQDFGKDFGNEGFVVQFEISFFSTLPNWINLFSWSLSLQDLDEVVQELRTRERTRGRFHKYDKMLG
jgi:hypothetical protein